MDSDALDNPPGLDSYPERHTESHPQPQPGRLPVFVLVPPDAILILDSYGDGRVEFRLHDADEAHIATLVGHRDGADCWRLTSVWRVGEQLLPVRPQPEPQPDADAVAEPITHSISTTGPLDGPYEYTVSHSHPHGHGAAVPTHSHPHPHSGAAAAGASALGHANQPHDHRH